MSDETQAGNGGSSVVRNVLFLAGTVYVLLSLYLIYDLRGRITQLESKQTAAEAKLGEKIAATQTEARRSAEALSSEVGQTKEEIEARAAELARLQRAAETRLSSNIKETQQQAAQQIGAVSGEVAGVKTEVGGVKSEVATAKSDLEATKAKLERAIGDLGLQSGLIARTRDELEVLKHKGDRNYQEFTLTKSKQTSAVGTVSLRLKKTDAKRGKFTLDVVADDRTIEKKDRTANEPLQFYSGKDRQLYELVVFEVSKDRVSGYLSTPKR